MTSVDTTSIDFEKACEKLSKVVMKTPLQFHARLSEKYQCEIYLKCEEPQVVRSYKIRSDYNQSKRNLSTSFDFIFDKHHHYLTFVCDKKFLRVIIVHTLTL